MSSIKRKMQKAHSIALFSSSTVKHFHTSLFGSISFNSVFQPRLNYAFLNFLCFVCYVIYDFYFHNLYVFSLFLFLRPLFYLLLSTVKCLMRPFVFTSANIFSVLTWSFFTDLRWHSPKIYFY